MNALKISLEYMQLLLANRRGEVAAERFYFLLAPSLSFITPHYQMNSAKEYIESLKISEPEPFSFSLLHSFEDQDSACLIYYYQRKNKQAYISQTFEVNQESKIESILMIYDGQALT